MNTLETRREFLHGACRSMLKSQLNIDFVNIKEIIGEKLDYEIEDEDMIYDPNSPFMDTCIREAAFDCVAKFYLKRDWPTYGEKADMEQFMDNLMGAIRKRNENFQNSTI